MDRRHIYVVFSSTPYTLGKAIRTLTRETYNHVSIALDQDLTQMYGFARRYYKTPLYGGFVAESPSRYYRGNTAANIRVCQLEVTQGQYEQLQQRLLQMYSHREQYLYNHLSALSSLLRRSVRLRDAYTCVEFCVHILASLGLDVNPKRFYSVGDLERLLRPYTIYTGPIPLKGNYDAVYYAQNPIPHPTWTTVRNLFALVPRMSAK